MAAEFKPTKLGFHSSLKFITDSKQFIDSRLNSLDAWYQINFGIYKLNVVSDFEILNYILKENESNYIKSKVYWRELKRMVGPSVGTLEGNDWKMLRKLESVHFTPKSSHEFMSSYERYVDQLLRNYTASETTFNSLESFSILNITFILKTLFEMDESEEAEHIAEYIADGEAIITYRSKFPWRPYTAWLNGMNQRYRKYVRYFHNYAQSTITHFKKSPRAASLINSLLNEDNLPYDKTELLRNEIIVHLGASIETTAVAETWILYLLARNPVKLKILEDELQQIDSPFIGTEHIDKLKYTTAVVYESLRLYPPSHAIVRDAIHDDLIFGYEVKSKEVMFISSYAMHRNPKYWDSPNEFIPERFLDANLNQMDYYIPFGAGKHTCIGQHMALPMVLLAISNFINQFEFTIKNAQEIKGVALSTLKPIGPLLLTIKRKNNENPLG